MEEIIIVQRPIALKLVQKMAEATFGEMVKAVVDVERKLIAIGGELHADAEAMLLDDGSQQKNLWGINLYPAEKNEQFVRYTSLINIRPSQGNRTLDVGDLRIRNTIDAIIKELVMN